MVVSLFVLGFLLAAGGGVLVVLGIPINEFGLGNTFIVAGTIAFVGGLVLIGLGEAARQLRRIAESLMARPSPRMARPSEPFEPLATAARNAPGRMAFPPRPVVDSRGRAPAAFEYGLAAPPIDATDEDFDRPAPPFSPPGAPEPDEAPERDEAPLSPQGPAQGRLETRFSPMDVVPQRREPNMQPGRYKKEKESLSVSELDMNLRPASPNDSSAQGGPFESVWPAEPGPGRSSVESKQHVADAERGEHKDPAKGPKTEETSAEPHAVSILKSGIVDGMAYTLYSDGSIEAEMPQGTVRFASIAELRDYLDKSS